MALAVSFLPEATAFRQTTNINYLYAWIIKDYG